MSQTKKRPHVAALVWGGSSKSRWCLSYIPGLELQTIIFGFESSDYKYEINAQHHIHGQDRVLGANQPQTSAWRHTFKRKGSAARGRLPSTTENASPAPLGFGGVGSSSRQGALRKLGYSRRQRRHRSAPIYRRRPRRRKPEGGSTF